MEIVAGLLALLLLLTWYGFWTAGRLDRLHSRLDAAAAALDAQLRVRSEATARFADQADLPRPVIGSLAQAAEIAAEVPGLSHEREVVENVLSRALGAAAEDAADQLSASETGRALVEASVRASFARRFHNDADRDALIVRRRRIVRWLHLAGHAPLPQYFEMVEPPLTNSEVAVVTSPYD